VRFQFLSALPQTVEPFSQFSRRRVMEGRASSDASDHSSLLLSNLCDSSAGTSAIHYQFVKSFASLRGQSGNSLPASSIEIYRHRLLFCSIFTLVCIHIGDPPLMNMEVANLLVSAMIAHNLEQMMPEPIAAIIAERSKLQGTPRIATVNRSFQ